MNTYISYEYPYRNSHFADRQRFYEGDVQFAALREMVTVQDVIQKDMGDLFDALMSGDSWTVCNDRQ